MSFAIFVFFQATDYQIHKLNCIENPSGNIPAYASLHVFSCDTCQPLPKKPKGHLRTMHSQFSLIQSRFHWYIYEDNLFSLQKRTLIVICRDPQNIASISNALLF